MCQPTPHTNLTPSSWWKPLSAWTRSWFDDLKPASLLATFDSTLTAAIVKAPVLSTATSSPWPHRAASAYLHSDLIKSFRQSKFAFEDVRLILRGRCGPVTTFSLISGLTWCSVGYLWCAWLFHLQRFFSGSQSQSHVSSLQAPTSMWRASCQPSSSVALRCRPHPLHPSWSDSYRHLGQIRLRGPKLLSDKIGRVK